MVGGKDLVVDEILLSHEKSHIINPPNVDWKRAQFKLHFRRTFLALKRKREKRPSHETYIKKLEKRSRKDQESLQWTNKGQKILQFFSLLL